jgi:hypothetical protein
MIIIYLQYLIILIISSYSYLFAVQAPTALSSLFNSSLKNKFLRVFDDWRFPNSSRKLFVVRVLNIEPLMRYFAVEHSSSPFIIFFTNCYYAAMQLLYKVHYYVTAFYTISAGQSIMSNYTYSLKHVTKRNVSVNCLNFRQKSLVEFLSLNIRTLEVNKFSLFQN